MATHSCVLSHGQRSLVGYSPYSLKESDMTEAIYYPCTHTKREHCCFAFFKKIVFKVDTFYNTIFQRLVIFLFFFLLIHSFLSSFLSYFQDIFSTILLNTYR